jgi:hypothetical protein
MLRPGAKARSKYEREVDRGFLPISSVGEEWMFPGMNH